MLGRRAREEEDEDCEEENVRNELPRLRMTANVIILWTILFIVE